MKEKNSELTYEIFSGNHRFDWFKIDSKTGLVTTKSHLNFEDSQQILLNISAHDGGSDPKYSFTSLKIDIQDENDEIPTFEKTGYKRKVKENNPSSFEILKLKANDYDSGSNGTVKYYLHPDTETQYPGLFNVEINTGSLIAEVIFDRESQPEYQIKVIAQDQGTLPLSSTAVVEITVKDANDNSPIFAPQVYYVEIPDGSGNGTQIVKVRAIDKDAGDYGKISYKLRNNLNRFSVDATTGILTTTRQLNVGNYTVIVAASDGGGKNSLNDASIHVIVATNSGVKPNFDKQLFEFEIFEDNGSRAQTGREVGRTIAKASGSTVEYAITDGDDNDIFLISSTGIITTNKLLDREERSFYSLTVIAHTDKRISAAKVNIKVKDVNDNPPKFLAITREAQVLENWPVGENIFSARAVDLDEGENSRISYKLELVNHNNGIFDINPDTGAIYLSKPPEQMSEPFVTLDVTASDSGNPIRSSKMSVKIRNVDVNNHTPLFPENHYELFLPESQAVSKTVKQLKAIDKDKGKNADLTYSIIRGNEDSRFGIFPNGGLYVARTLDRELRDMYSLTVLVQDSGDEPRHSKVNITVFVQDENDNAPNFDKPMYEFSVLENLEADTYVGSVKARDQDQGRNSDIWYSLVGNNENFTINFYTGDIYTSKSFDREYVIKTTNTAQYKFSVMATDDGIHKLKGVVSVVVNILDQNDNAPKFSLSLYQTAERENFPENEVVYTMVATDEDEGPNAAITYSITDGNQDGYFSVHATSGEVVLEKSMDRETQDNYLLTIKATDTGEHGQKAAITKLQIIVIDVNDNSPQFKPNTVSSVHVSELETIGETISIFEGTDKDTGNFGSLTYKITSGNEKGIFDLGITSGKLKLKKSLNYRDDKVFNLVITVSDYGSPPKSDSMQFTVYVDDENNNAPEWKDGAVRFQISENKPERSLVGKLKAVDADSGKFGEVRYSIFKHSPAFNHFQIHPVTGEITVISELDREQISYYTLTVHAIDQDPDITSRQTSEKTITIDILDVNDNAPVFRSPEVFLVPSATSRGSTVATLSATDVDGDKNDNNKISFGFSGVKPSLFNINPTTGSVSLAEDFPNNQLEFTVRVRASDNSTIVSERRSTTMTITILLYTSSGRGPSFISGLDVTGSVSENARSGTSVNRVTATPSAVGLSVKYYITKVAGVSGKTYGGVFSIGISSGVISTTSELDREILEEEFIVDITAVETQNTEQRATTDQITVRLEDENDNPPQFSSSVYSVYVPEETKRGEPVARVYVQDLDVTSRPSLSITGSGATDFRINDTGVVFTLLKLDYSHSVHELIIQASDGVHKTTCKLYVHVIDQNNNAPVFGKPFFSFSIPEDAKAGYTIDRVKATDQDAGNNGHVLYELASEWGQDMFELDPVLGEFTLINQLDYEARHLYMLTVMARDEGQEPMSSEVLVYMNVLDINDNQPEFDPMSYDTELPEDANLGTVVVNVSATDVDSGRNGEVRYSLSKESSRFFDIGPINGSLYTTSKLDREDTPLHQVIVIATDQAEDPTIRKLTSAIVTVRLKDINDCKPEFTSPTHITVMENSKLDTSVFSIGVVDKDAGANSRVSFKLVSQSTPGVFSLSPNSGDLILEKALDREITPNHTLVISVSDHGKPKYTSQQTLEIKVSDFNDNKPVFSSSVYTETIKENVMVGTSVLRLMASDKDEGQNSAVRYFILGGEGSHDFSLDVTSGVLRVKKALDYERMKSYSITVQAEDSSIDTPLRDNATIQIKVTDINDFVPVFDNSPYHAFVQEGLTGNVPVINISARDEDSGNNGKISYSIRLFEHDDLFEVDAISGQVIAKQALDRETIPMYVATIVAIDNGSPTQTGTATLTIFVKDVNDHPPVFESTGTYYAHVTENLPIQTEVVTVSASDKDEGLNAKISYKLKDTMGDRFAIEPTSGKIVTTSTLDRERETGYTLTIVASDQGIPQLSATAKVHITIDDGNDHAPEFDVDRYSVFIESSSKTADFVVGVTAMDRDIGQNGKVVYTTEGKDKEYFHISTETGVVKLAKSLGQTKNIYNFVVRASDLGIKPLHSTANVSVQLTTPTDTSNRPSFDRFQSNPIDENAETGQVLTTVHAMSSRGPVTYHLVGGNINNAFSIHANTGVISVANPIDHEVTSRFTLWLEARDSGSPSLSAFREISVDVNDVNDNAPVFHQTSFSAKVKENSANHTEVLKVQALDADSGDNAQLVYEIKLGNTNNTFSIDNTGKVQTQNYVDREKIPSYNLVIEASDKGSPRRSTTATIHIEVEDLNDNQPLFLEPRSIAIPEDLSIESLVMQLSTSDKDVGDNAKTIFEFDTSDGVDLPFAIDATSGNITVIKELDMEKVQRYTPKVSVSDGLFVQRTSLAIRLLDVNDNVPKFQSSVLNFSLREMQSPGTLVGQLTAEDNDISELNKKLFFSLRHPSSLFELDSTSGYITALETMRYIAGHSLMNEYMLNVMVTDLGMPPLSSQATVIIKVTDDNDHAPVFKQSEYFSAVPYNLSTTQSILKVTAVDSEDFGKNAQIQYSILLTGNGYDYFKIDKNTGEISPKTSLSKQTNYKFILSVQAQDLGSPPQRSDVKVVLEITDINRNTPVFNRNIQFFKEVNENTPEGTIIAVIGATDEDENTNGEVEYFITSGNEEEVFEIGQEDGRLKVAGTLDYESRKDYSITITARDKGLFSKEVSRIYKINLKDINDNPPKFDQRYYDAYVQENSKQRVSVIEILATDKDTAYDNVQVKYSIVGDASSKQFFEMNEDTGEIHTNAVFDYEERNLYTLLVMAYNAEPSKNQEEVMKSMTTVYIHVTGVNEHIPKFVKSTYNFEVSESAEIGTSLGRVSALDKDKGSDGVVYYYLEGSSNLFGFSVDALGGVIRVSERPDYESSPHILLNVLAKNRGAVQGKDTDSCIVNITVMDANDPPEFTKPLYSARIPENSESNVHVVTVKAEDNDYLLINRKFTYIITAGNVREKFYITSGGKILTTGQGILDREASPFYLITVEARDTGIPPRTGTTSVNITLEDENDNPPRFDPVDFTAYVPENETAGHLVTVLSEHTKDIDEPKNQGPFSYQMVDGSWSEFFKIRASDGRVETRKVLDRKQSPQFSVQVVVSDNGIPRRSSTLTFTIVVNDKDNQPPQKRAMTLLINVFEGAKFTGTVANVSPVETDISGKYTCSIVSGADRMFSIRNKCDLIANGILKTQAYKVVVRATDGKFPSIDYTATIEVREISKEFLKSSGVILLGNQRGHLFLQNTFSKFEEAVEQSSRTFYSCHVFSLREEQGDLLVMFYVLDENNKLIDPTTLIQELTTKKSDIEKETGLTIKAVSLSKCEPNPCLNQGVCSTVVSGQAGSPQLTFSSHALVLTSSSPTLKADCQCPAAFTGERCDVPQAPCGFDFCHNGGSCVNDVCECSGSWKGKFCLEDVNECLKNPCQNEATCHNTNGSFDCICPTGYSGQYCEQENPCAAEDCSGQGTCLDIVGSEARCSCNYGFFGARCQFSSLSFKEDSYAEFEPVNNYHEFKLSLYFATIDKNALIMFSPVLIGDVVKDKGFIAVEIIEKKIRVSFQLRGRTNAEKQEPVRLSAKEPLTAGVWHRLEFNKYDSVASLTVQRCDVTCTPCSDQDDSCFTKVPLNFNKDKLEGQHLSIGGVRNFNEIQELNGDVWTHDFRGCIHSVAVNDRLLDISPNRDRSYLISSSGVVAGCPRDAAASSCSSATPCKNSGTCVDEWDHVRCSCSTEYADDYCSVEKQPFGLSAQVAVTYSLKQKFVRDQKLNTVRERSRRAVDGSSLEIRFRTTQPQGILFTSKTSAATLMLWFEKSNVYWHVKTQSISDPLAIPEVKVVDGSWHNVTVKVTGNEYSLQYDAEPIRRKTFDVEHDFASLDILEMGISGNKTLPDNRKIPGLSGCISYVLIDGESLPLSGYSERYRIDVAGNMSNGCQALCYNNPCGGNNKCVLNGETYKCLLVADEASGLETGIIIVIVFFAVLVIAIIVIFILFRTRRDLFQRCDRNKKQRPGVSSNGGKVNVDNIIPADSINGISSRYPNRTEEELIIRNHIVEELTGHKNVISTQPDLIGSSYSPQPFHLPDGTIIMESRNLNSFEEEAPEHYDFENASSIAPSDIAPSDIVRHYRDFRNNTHHHHHRHHQLPPIPPANSHLFNKYRDSPTSVSASHYRASPHIPPVGHLPRQSPMSHNGSALSVPAQASPMMANVSGARPSSALASINPPRQSLSPITQLNVRSPHIRSNYTSKQQHSSSNSSQSIGSHHSHSSSSSTTGAPAPNSNFYKNKSRSRTPRGLTVEDVNRLNARPDFTDPVSMLDVTSSSIHHHKNKNRNIHQEPVLDSSVLLDPPDSSSDDSGANDSFTCSEFEYDNEPTRNRLDFDHSKMIFPKLAEVEETDELIPHIKNGKLNSGSDGLNSNGESFGSTNASSSGSPASQVNQQPLSSQYDFDNLLNWGPKFDKLVGVFRDIAQLPDTGQVLDGAVDHDYEEYV